jgi:transposase-like protein
MANTHRTPEQWQQIVKQHASSGLQITAFCKQQKLNPSSFYPWRKRLVNNGKILVLSKEIFVIMKLANKRL